MTVDPALTLLEDLVAIDSVNPSLVPGARGEADAAGRVAAECRALGLEVHVTEVAPGRPNVVAVLEGRAPGASLMFCGHIDTVGVAGMAKPFTPVTRDGRLYGRGAQDMKGGVAAMIAAARRLVEEGGLSSGRLILAAVVDEEHSSIGAEALVADWRADAAVVTEPTDLDVGVAHKGFQWLEVDVRGRAAHGSRPHDGRDAILRMGRVLGRLEALDRALQRRPGHPVLGVASLHASLISGGRELSSYPGECRLQLERRTLPGEAAGSGLREVEEILGGLGDEDGFEAHARLLAGRDAYEVDPANELPHAILRAATSAGATPQRVGVSFWTDAAILGSAGIPAVLFGPGGAGLHSTEEYVWIDQVLRCRDSLAALARTWCCGREAEAPRASA